MSYTEIKKVTPDGEVVGVKEFRNAHGFGAFIYTTLTAKYIDAENPRGWIQCNSGNLPLWSLIDSPKLAACERVVLALSFDLVWVNAADALDVAKYLREFVELHPPGDHVCHLIDIAYQIEGEWDSADGVAFYGMSVAEDVWVEHDPCKTCGSSENSDGRPFNVRTDAGALMLNLEALERCEGEKFHEGKGE